MRRSLSSFSPIFRIKLYFCSSTKQNWIVISLSDLFYFTNKQRHLCGLLRVSNRKLGKKAKLLYNLEQFDWHSLTIWELIMTPFNKVSNLCSHMEASEAFFCLESGKNCQALQTMFEINFRRGSFGQQVHLARTCRGRFL